MNKRRRYKAKRRRARIKSVIRFINSFSNKREVRIPLQIIPGMNIPYTQIKGSTDSWLGFTRRKDVEHRSDE